MYFLQFLFHYFFLSLYVIHFRFFFIIKSIKVNCVILVIEILRLFLIQRLKLKSNFFFGRDYFNRNDRDKKKLLFVFMSMR